MRPAVGHCRRAGLPGRSTRAQRAARRPPAGPRPTGSMRADHDRAVAAISHLPLALAAALVQAVGDADDWPLARALAAGGWASATRLARGDVTMGAGIAATNAPELARRIRALAGRSSTAGWPTSRRRPTIRPRPRTGSRSGWRPARETARGRAIERAGPGRAAYGARRRAAAGAASGRAISAAVHRDDRAGRAIRAARVGRGRPRPEAADPVPGRPRRIRASS